MLRYLKLDIGAVEIYKRNQILYLLSIASSSKVHVLREWMGGGEKVLFPVIQVESGQHLKSQWYYFHQLQLIQLLLKVASTHVMWQISVIVHFLWVSTFPKWPRLMEDGCFPSSHHLSIGCQPRLLCYLTRIWVGSYLT